MFEYKYDLEFQPNIKLIHERVDASTMTDKEITGCKFNAKIIELCVCFDTELGDDDEATLHSIVVGADEFQQYLSRESILGEIFSSATSSEQAQRLVNAINQYYVFSAALDNSNYLLARQTAQQVKDAGVIEQVDLDMVLSIVPVPIEV